MPGDQPPGVSVLAESRLRLGQRARQGLKKDAEALQGRAAPTVRPVAVYESGRERTLTDHQALVLLIAEMRKLREAQEILVKEVRKLARAVRESYTKAKTDTSPED